MAASPDHESVAQDEQLHELIAEYHRVSERTRKLLPERRFG
jgi:hypothetical protein